MKALDSTRQHSTTRHRLAAIVVFCLVADSAPAARDHAVEPYAVYRGDQGLQRHGSFVTQWDNTAPSSKSHRRHLTRMVGRPRAVKVMTASGEAAVVRFDGKSALWQPSGAWGSLESDRTVVVYLKLDEAADGFLFDGSTRTGMTRAQIRGRRWQTGTQPPPIGNASRADSPTHVATVGQWEVHGFVVRPQASSVTVRHRLARGESANATSGPDVPLSGFILGANAAAQHGLKVDVAEVQVFSRALGDAEFDDVADGVLQRWGTPRELPEGFPDPVLADDPRVFRKVLRRQGEDGVHTYRIPGLVTSPNGTLIAVFDLRHDNPGDLPGNIDVGMMRSTDNGGTWSGVQTILDYDESEPGAQGNGVGDPAILVDQKSGVIFVAGLWSKGNRAWVGSGPGMAPEDTGQWVLTRSDDDGITWSEPINITSQVKHPEWRLCYQGPGRGIQVRDGTLVFPAQYIDAGKIPHSFFIYSEDHGDTWKVVAPPVAGTDLATTEAQVAELPNGDILISMRNHDARRQRAWANFHRNPRTGRLEGGTWSPVWFTRDDPTCMAALVSHADAGVLLFANPATKSRRQDMTVALSRDGGRSWPVSRLLDWRPSAYSCLTVLRDGTIGLLYETGDTGPYETLTFARFPLEWLLDTGETNESEPDNGSCSSLLLGPGHDVLGLASPGRGVIHRSMRVSEPRTFILTAEHTAALHFRPDMVIRHLGINDIMGWNRFGAADFVDDPRELLTSYRALPSSRRLIPWQPLAPLFARQTFHGDKRVEESNQAIATVAKLEGVEVVDMASPLRHHAAMFSDHPHPDRERARRIAETIAAYLHEPTPGDATKQ